ncbi:Ubiquitin carboxyl-terminal hydrolase 21 [Linum perenne]
MKDSSTPGGAAVADIDLVTSSSFIETLDEAEFLELSDLPEADGPSVGIPDFMPAETLATPAGFETEDPGTLQHPRDDEVVSGGSSGVGLGHIDFKYDFTSSGSEPLDCEVVVDESSNAQLPETTMDDFVDENHTPVSDTELETGASVPASPEGKPCYEEPDCDEDEDRELFTGYGPLCRPRGRSIAYSTWKTDPWASKDDPDDAMDKPTSFFPLWRKTVPTGMGAGLYNLGNTCFINAILQCFTHTVPLVKALRSHNHSLPCERGIDGFCVLDALRDHTERSLASSGKTISPQNLFDNLSCISSFFRRYQQEDAHEFLQCLLDRLERCCLDPNLPEGSSSSDASNIVQQTFGGRLVSKLKCCSCGHFSDKYEPLIDLSLEIEEVGNLHDALESFTKVERIEDSETKLTCDGCKDKVTMEKQLMLDRTPLIATLHLKRFKTDGYSVDKIGKHVEFPLELDLMPYSNHEKDINQVNLKYQLYGVVVHNGFLPTSGHYFCYIRSSPGKWHKLDDTRVTECREEFVLSQSAYILLYARDGTPWFSSLMESQKFTEDLGTTSTSPKSVLQTVDGDDGLVGDADVVMEPQTNSLCKSVAEEIEIPEQRDEDLDEGPIFYIDEVPVVKPLGADGDQHDTSEPIDVTLNKEKSCPQLSPPSSNDQTCFKSDRNDEPLPTRSGPSTNYNARVPETKNRAAKEQQMNAVNTLTEQKATRKGGNDPQKTEAIRYINKKMPSGRRNQLLSALDPHNDKERLRSSTCKRSSSPDSCRRVVRRTQLTR